MKAPAIPHAPLDVRRWARLEQFRALA